MNRLIKISVVLLVVLLSVSSSTKKPTNIVRDDLKKHYDQYKVTGSFVLYDPQELRYTFCNKSQYEKEFSPASTFKICNSLIGLETGVIADENFVLTWDSVVRRNAPWNQDQDLKTAFKNSTVWYYQELARRVGGVKMKHWLDKSGYGNRDTTGGIDKFWLSGGLRVTPKQQIEFLQKLHDNTLPFSQRSMDIVKRMMIAKDTAGYVLRAKTGWAGNDTQDVGWYVGYLETNEKVYYFANCVQSSDLKNTDFARSRIEIVYLNLKALNLISAVPQF
jgi:beta-lactamase class D